MIFNNNQNSTTYLYFNPYYIVFIVIFKVLGIFPNIFYFFKSVWYHSTEFLSSGSRQHYFYKNRLQTIGRLKKVIVAWRRRMTFRRKTFERVTLKYSLIGIAMPYPFESNVLPICIRLQLRSVWYSMLDDSIRNAYRPLPFSTRSTPSWLLFVNTVGLDDSITLHILWYRLKFDFCARWPGMR